MTDYPVLTNLVLLQGSTFNPVLTAYDGPNPATANKIDWTGYKARMQVRADVNSGTVIFSLYSDTTIPSTVNGSSIASTEGGITVAGTSVTLNLAADQTDLLNFQTAQYDIEMYNDAVSPVYVYRAFQGTITNNQQITR